MKKAVVTPVVQRVLSNTTGSLTTGQAGYTSGNSDL